MPEIDKIKVAALRKADRVCFYHREGESYIRAIKEQEVTASDPFRPKEVDLHIDCGTVFTRYDGPSWPVPEFTAFHMIHVARHSAEWQTIAGLLKAGDRLKLHWRRGSLSTDAMKGVRWAGDDLLLVVDRGEKRLTFHIGSHVTEANNRFRMVRAADYVREAVAA